MAVTTSGGPAHASAVQIAEVQLEARRPPFPTFGVLTGEVCDVFRSSAEAGRTDHRAVAACEAPIGDLMLDGGIAVVC